MTNIYGKGNIICLGTESTELQPITVVNTGGTVITNMVLTVTIPAGLTYDSHTASVGTFDGTLWTIPSLAINDSATLNICFEVTDDTELPWEITYSAVHDDTPDSVPPDDEAERNFIGFACSKFDKCWASLEEFDSMAEAIADLGNGKMFLASMANIEGWAYRAVLVTPLT